METFTIGELRFLDVALGRYYQAGFKRRDLRGRRSKEWADLGVGTWKKLQKVMEEAQKASPIQV